MDHSIINSKEDLCDPIENFLVKHTDYMFDSYDVQDFKIPDSVRIIPKNISNEYSFNGGFKRSDKNYGCFGAS